jgi:hypothetical protein
VQCTGKQVFASKAAALRVAKKLKWKAGVYRCPFCDRFHIGHV